MKNPWRTLRSKMAYRNPFWQAYQNEVIKPDGQRDVYYTVRRGDFSIVVPLSKDRRFTYLVCQWRYPTNQPSWEFSAGFIEKNETPLQAARRELAEETGLEAKKLYRVGSSYSSPGFTDQKFYVYVAENLQVGRQRLEGSEADMIVKKYTLGRVKQMIKRGEITDAASVVAFYYLELFLQRL